MKFKKLHKNINFNSALVKAKVMNALGSTPNNINDFMLIAENDIFGTIGGGTLEFQVINEAKKLLINNNKESSLKIPLGPGIGQCCGGFVEIKLTAHSNLKNAIRNEIFDESNKLDLYISNSPSFKISSPLKPSLKKSTPEDDPSIDIPPKSNSDMERSANCLIKL